MVFGINVEPADKDTVNRFETQEGWPALSAAPYCVPRSDILPGRKYESHVQGNAHGGQRFQGSQASPGGRHFDHAIGVTCTPIFPQGDVPLRSFLLRQVEFRIL